MWLLASSQLVSLATAGRFLTGFGSAFAFVGVLKLATIWLPEDRLALVAGLAAALGTVGAMVGDNLLGAIVARMGWQHAVNYTAIFGLGVIALMWFGIHDKKKNIDEDGGTVTTFARSFLDLKLILTNKQIWINGGYGCLIYLPTTVFAELWGIPYLSHAHGMTPASAEFSNSLVFMGFTVGAPLWGYFSDKIKQRRLPMLIGAVGAGVLMTVILYLPGLSGCSLNITMFILGLFYSVQAVVFAVGRELSPSEAGGTAIAITNMFVMLGAMLLQPLIGHLLDWSLRASHIGDLAIKTLTGDQLRQLYTASDYRLAMAVIPIGVFCAAILTFFLKETHAHAERNPKKL